MEAENLKNVEYAKSLNSNELTYPVDEIAKAARAQRLSLAPTL
jgi:hypothetical protein